MPPTPPQRKPTSLVNASNDAGADADVLEALLAAPSGVGEDEAPSDPPETDRFGVTLREAPDPTSARNVTPQEREAFWSTLMEKPWSHDFFAAVRRMEALYPELPGFGASARATEDLVRFSQHPSLTFAPCTMPECRAGTDRAPARLFVNFLGMLGPNGPMPLHLTEYARGRQLHHKDHTFSRFLDMFNHRMISLFYRAWSSSSMPASFDRTPPAALSGEVNYLDREKVFASEKDRYPVYIGALFGLGMEAVRHRDAVPDIAKLHFAGRLAGLHKGPEGLAAILGSYFKVPVSIREFVGRFVQVPMQYRTRLGGGPDVARDRDALAAATLGTAHNGAMIVGSRVWDAQGGFDVTMGPMGFNSFVTFVPGSSSERRLRAWIRNYLGDEFAWSVTIELRANEVPKTQLVSRAKLALGQPGSRLGWTTWIASKPETQDRGDLRVRADQRA